MADLYEDYGLEIEPDNFGADPQLTPQKTTVVKKGGILGKVVALALGFTIGAGGVIGGVAGAGYFMASTPIKDAVGAVGNLAGIEIDYSKFLTEDYAKLTVIELVQALPSIAEKFGNGTGTLNDLNKISPLVSTALDPVLEKVAEFGLTLDKDTLMDTPVGELAAYITEEAKNMKLADLLNTAGMAETPLIKAICYDQDGNPTTIKDLMDGGPEGLLGNIPLEALLIAEDGVVNPDKDTLIMALAYGNNNRYTVGADNKVTMNQMAFSRIGNELFDIDGNKVEDAVLGADGVFTVTDEDGNVYYAAPQAATFALRAAAIPYYAYKDAACETALTYKKAMVGDLLGGNATDLFNELELGTLFNISPLDEDADPITLALAYGEEGVHYEIENDKIVWLGDNKPRTIGTLLEGELTSIMNELKLGTLLDISPLDKYDPERDDPDPLMLALAYGEEGTHYEIVETNGVYEIEWKVKDAVNGIYYSARTIENLTKDAEEIFNDIQLGTVLSVKVDDPTADRMTHALAFGYEGEHFEINDGTVTWLNGNKPKTVKDMTNMGTILDTLRIATVLDVDPLDTSKTQDEMTLAIAYGYEGTHYELIDTNSDGVDDKIVWLEDENGDPYSPRTVDDLSTMGSIINDIRIESALSVTYESPRLLHVLAYGSEGDGFDYIKDGETIVGLEAYKYNTIASLSSAENNLIDTLTLADIIGAEAVEDDLLLSHLGEATLETLPNEIANLTFKQVYPEQIYETRYLTKNGIELNYDSATDKFSYIEGGNTHFYIGKVIVQYKVDYVEDQTGTNKIDRVNWPQEIDDDGDWVNETDLAYHGDDGYYHIEGVTDYQVHLKLTSQWKYLLVGSDGEAHDYKMTEFATLVENMTHNMTNATLRELDADGIVDLTEDTLETELITEIKITVNSTVYSVGTVDYAAPGGVTKLGDLTITQILEYTAKVMTAVNNLTLSITP